MREPRESRSSWRHQVLLVVGFTLTILTSIGGTLLGVGAIVVATSVLRGSASDVRHVLVGAAS